MQSTWMANRAVTHQSRETQFINQCESSSRRGGTMFARVPVGTPAMNARASQFPATGPCDPLIRIASLV